MTYNPAIILESFQSPLIYLIYGKKKEHLPRTNLKIILKIALSIQHLLYRNHVFTACYPVEGNTWHEGKYDGLLKKNLSLQKPKIRGWANTCPSYINKSLGVEVIIGCHN